MYLENPAHITYDPQKKFGPRTCTSIKLDISGHNINIIVHMVCNSQHPIYLYIYIDEK